EGRGQGVHHGDTDTVQTAGDGVGIGVELAAGVELGEDDLDSGDAGGVHTDGDTATVVDDLDTAVGEEGDLHLRCVSGHGLVDGVVDDLPDQVVQATLSGGTDVHTGALAHRLETLEDGDGRRTVLTLVVVRLLGSHGWVALLLRSAPRTRATHSCPSYVPASLAPGWTRKRVFRTADVPV